MSNLDTIKATRRLSPPAAQPPVKMTRWKALRTAAAGAETSNKGAFDIAGARKPTTRPSPMPPCKSASVRSSSGVVYATNDGGAYKVDKMPHGERQTRALPTLLHSAAANCGDTKTAMPTASTMTDAADAMCGPGETAPVKETTSRKRSQQRRLGAGRFLVKNTSSDWDTWGAGVTYSDGPMSASLGHLATDWDNGGAQEATMLSMSYSLAPGVAPRPRSSWPRRSSGRPAARCRRHGLRHGHRDWLLIRLPTGT